MRAKDCPVIGPRGFRGKVDLTDWPGMDEKPTTPVDVVLPGEVHLLVPAEALIEQKDGSFYLPHRMIRRRAG